LKKVCWSFSEVS